MIGYLNGKVLDTDGTTVLLSVNGVGYEVNCSLSVFQRLTNSGQGEVYTYLAVREDGVFLYGFDTMQEKAMFLKLITVSGVGPKMGITVLSAMDLNSLALAIATSDVKTLSKVKGLGKKTAERIILELREKVTALSSAEDEKAIEKVAVNEDAVLALMTLGFTKGESVRAVENAMENGATTIEDIIKSAIKNAGKR